ncbi:ParA family protein [Aquabacterium sp.]|uniref:ParA family protein n=1 Tax=Aquabacterium sp. TaxID=1872578 RepID=UPI002488544F|nr:ParA family protein [Aquabacterium sp.]MDI1259583.1 ParA family protein [Aquabacterium sp.]
MTRKVTALNSKGGVGKSTTLANLGGLLADMGARVLLFDGDIQPTLSKYYPLEYEAPHGLVEVVTSGIVSESCISRTYRPNLHLIKSNDGNARLQFWLDARPDRRTRLAVALSAPIIEDNYDFVLIDTQGAIGPVPTAAAFAADTVLCPLPPDTASIREFSTGTLHVLSQIEGSPDEPNTMLAPLHVLISKAVDADRKLSRGSILNRRQHT